MTPAGITVAPEVRGRHCARRARERRALTQCGTAAAATAPLRRPRIASFGRRTGTGAAPLPPCLRVCAVCSVQRAACRGRTRSALGPPSRTPPSARSSQRTVRPAGAKRLPPRVPPALLSPSPRSQSLRRLPATVAHCPHLTPVIGMALHTERCKPQESRRIQHSYAILYYTQKKGRQAATRSLRLRRIST